MNPGEDINRVMERAMFAFDNQILASFRAILEQEQVPRPVRHRTSVRREHGLAHQRLFKDYFADEPRWGPMFFRRRFRMRRELFLRIVHAMEARDEYFQQQQDAANRIDHPRLRSAWLRFVSWPRVPRWTCSMSIFTPEIQLAGSV